MSKVSFFQPAGPVIGSSRRRGPPNPPKKTFGAGNSRIGKLPQKQSGVSAEKIALLSGGVLAAAVLYTAYQWDINAVPTLIGNGISQVRDWAGSMFTDTSKDLLMKALEDQKKVNKELETQRDQCLNAADTYYKMASKCVPNTKENCQSHINDATRGMIKSSECTVNLCQTHIEKAKKAWDASKVCTVQNCQAHINSGKQESAKQKGTWWGWFSSLL